MIYFIQAGDGGPIKIGYARNVERRFMALKTGTAKELAVLGVLEWLGVAEHGNYRRDDPEAFIAQMRRLLDENPAINAALKKIDEERKK